MTTVNDAFASDGRERETERGRGDQREREVNQGTKGKISPWIALVGRLAAQRTSHELLVAGRELAGSAPSPGKPGLLLEQPSLREDGREGNGVSASLVLPRERQGRSGLGIGVAG